MMSCSCLYRTVPVHLLYSSTFYQASNRHSVLCYYCDANYCTEAQTETQLTIFYCLIALCYQYFNVSSVRASVRECVTDVTSTDEPRLQAPAYIKAWQNQI